MINRIKYYISDKKDWNLSLIVGKNWLENRKKLLDKLWFNIEDLILPKQIHSDDIIIIDNNLNKESINLKWDAIITNLEWIIIWVLTADCIPIILFDDIKNIIWVIHAWWKGTSLWITTKTIQKMLDIWAWLNNINVIIWPWIDVKSYEVKEDILNNFSKEVIIFKENKYYLDLKLKNKLELLNIWIKEEKISIIDVDTYTNWNYFCARKNKDEWRFGTFIYLTKNYEN